MSEILNKHDKIEICRLIRDGLMVNMSLGQRVLENYLMGKPRNIQDMHNILVSKMIIPKIKKFCAPEIPPKTFDIYSEKLGIIIKDLSDI